MVFFKNVKAFESKCGHVFKKHGGLFGVGRKWYGATSTTNRFVLIFSDLSARCWMCRSFGEMIGVLVSFNANTGTIQKD